MSDGVAPDLLRAWLTGRSLARGVALPVADRGGFRVDTASPAEICRWVYPGIGPEIAEVARSVSGSGYLIKVCGAPNALGGQVPSSWHVEMTGFFMTGRMRSEAVPLPAGYSADVTTQGAVSEVTITAADGSLAARGFGGEAEDAFVYDRIGTEPAHRRKGLGLAVMTRLAATKSDARLPDLLVATEMGRALYEVLGWQVLSPYSTATSPSTDA